MKLDDKAVIIATAAIFIVIVTVLTLTQPAKRAESLYLNLSVGEEAGFDPSVMGNITQEEMMGSVQLGTAGIEGISPMPQGTQANCTPLGDINALMWLETKYVIYYGEEPVYVHSRLKDITSGYVVEQRTTAWMHGEPVETISYITYDFEGKCIQVQVSVKGMEQYFSGRNSIFRCSGYAFGIVCREMLNESYFDRDDVVEIRGRKYAARVYKSGNSELWVGHDPQVVFKYSFVGSGTNKSFSAELVDIAYRGGLK